MGRRDASVVAIRLAGLDRVALHAIRTHAEDAGYPLPASVRRVLRNAGVLDGPTLSPDFREQVLKDIQGRGIDVTICGAPPDPPATSDERDLIERLRRGDPDGAARQLLAMAARRAGHRWSSTEMRRWTAAAFALTDERGQATPSLQRVLQRVERLHAVRMTSGARALFQDLLAMTGCPMRGAIHPPLRRTSLWLRTGSPLAGYQSKPHLPTRADVVIIGAGLTGASAAYHLSGEAARGARIVLLEAGEPGGEASGRNGGNFELIPENFFGGYGTYDGLIRERAKFLKAAYPSLDPGSIDRQAGRIARAIIRFALANARQMMRTIRETSTPCDCSAKGWLRTALNEREARALRAEVALVRSMGGRARFIGPHAIWKQFGLKTRFGGRLILDNGNYHPVKFITGELRAALAKGVELYTRTRVQHIQPTRPDLHRVVTSRGIIRARRVIVATNAFTADLFPELSDIRPFRSQIANYEHVSNRLAGITFTCKDGDLYANFPASGVYRSAEGHLRGTLHVGGGLDTEIRSPVDVQPSREVFTQSRRETGVVFPETRHRPPSRLWAGPMAFVEGQTGMRLPVLGPLGTGPRKGIFIAVWCNGYGGTGCHLAGAGAAQWARTGRCPSMMPADIFGPARLFCRSPLFAREDSSVR